MRETARTLVTGIAEQKNWAIKDHIWDLCKNLPASILSSPALLSLALHDLAILYALTSKNREITAFDVCQEYVRHIQKSAATFSESISYQLRQDPERFQQLCTAECVKIALKLLNGTAVQEDAPEPPTRPC